MAKKQSATKRAARKKIAAKKASAKKTAAKKSVSRKSARKSAVRKPAAKKSAASKSIKRIAASTSASRKSSLPMIAGKIDLRQNSEYRGQNWWNWSLWIEAPPAVLNDIEYVNYKLHSTFTDPVQHRSNPQEKF